ncbi:MAG: hypothetical protein JST00_29745 [Deltaproteobacteria bacterium]|nr:hypothetical protein [Deltaproteobacteria bacterium]
MTTYEDDEGIIDLKAMASRSVAPRAPVAPLFSEPPPAIAVDATDATKAAKPGGLKTGLLVGGGALFVVATIGALVFAFRGETPTPRRNAAITPPAVVVAPPPAASASATEPAPAAAAPAAEAASEDDAKPTAKKKSGAKHGPSRVGPSADPHASTGGVASKTSAPVSKPVKAADPCHCRGDFQCNIRCSAGR